MQPIATHWSVEQFFAFEEIAIDKHEYIYGSVYQFVPINKNHSLISVNVMIHIGNQIKDTDYHGLASKMRIQINKSVYVFADFSVIHGQGEFADKETRLLMNPVFTCEVYSPETENYDKGLKCDFYRSLPSLQQYLLVDQKRTFIQVYTRQKDGWLLTEYDQRSQIVSLDSIGVQLPVDEVYRDIDL